MAELPESFLPLRPGEYRHRVVPPAPNWDALDPRQGLTVWEALCYFVDRDRALRAYQFAHQDPDADFTSKPDKPPMFRVKFGGLADGTFVAKLVEKLQSGELVARGFANSATLDAPRQAIHKDRWADLVLDARTSSASGQGITVSAILVFPGEATLALVSKGRKQYSPAQLRSWYVKRLDDLNAAGSRSSREEDCTAASEAFNAGVPKRAVLALRRELAPASWKRGGRPKG